jgi:hypothetical protein
MRPGYRATGAAKVLPAAEIAGDVLWNNRDIEKSPEGDIFWEKSASNKFF